MFVWCCLHSCSGSWRKIPVLLDDLDVKLSLSCPYRLLVMSHFTTTTRSCFEEHGRDGHTHLCQCQRLFPTGFLQVCSAKADREFHLPHKLSGIFLPHSCSLWRGLKLTHFAVFALLNFSPEWPRWAQGTATRKPAWGFFFPQSSSAFIAAPPKNGDITSNGLIFLITRVNRFIQLVRSVPKWGNKSHSLILVIWELDQKVKSENKHRANGMKNDSLGTSAFIALGEERGWALVQLQQNQLFMCLTPSSSCPRMSLCL